MSSYNGLAQVYDQFTGDVDYSRWLNWYQTSFRREKEPVELVLDLGCGTGTLTCLLAGLGYEMIGVDLSEEMLSQAMDKAYELELEKMPLFLCQSMAKLRLFGQVDACVCSLDSLNYLTRRRELESTLSRVAQYLKPGGLFLFDVIPPWEFARRDGEVFVDESEQALVLWRASYRKQSQIITYGLDLFHTQDGLRWTREQEEHRERGWEPELLECLLRERGFSQIRIYGSDRKSAPSQSDDRLFFVARRAVD
ncbi:MAG: class I SAM-dependent methyltransferase [Oscillospiraceae bacterium]|nr:class I SAM-dependent methyltransferase [Oscillospiraceae bacterium]